LNSVATLVSFLCPINLAFPKKIKLYKENKTKTYTEASNEEHLKVSKQKFKMKTTSIIAEWYENLLGKLWR
jgi:hypothetical protein